MKAIKICAVALALGFATMMVSATSSSALAASGSAWAHQTQTAPQTQGTTPQQPPESATPQTQQNPYHSMPNQEQPNQTEPGQQNPNATTPQAEPNTQGEQAAQFFVGKVKKQHGEYVLYVPVSRTTYKLSNQSEAEQFKGKNVKVQGTLDSSSNTINVTSIQPANQ